MKKLIFSILIVSLISWCTNNEELDKGKLNTPDKWKLNPNEEVMCTMEYAPVCWSINVQCIKAPCNPVQETFSNLCEANKRWAFNIKEWTCENQIEANSNEIDLSNCLSYYDGCNTCMVNDWEIWWCTKRHCQTKKEPSCLKYK